MVKPEVLAFTDTERLAVYRAIAERRDVRRGFLSTPLPDTLLRTLLEAAHSAPSVGLMQPWRFIIIRDPAMRRHVHSIFLDANASAIDAYEGDRRQLYASLKLEGLLEAPQHVCIVCDPQSIQGHGLGRQTMPEAAVYSTVCAVQNLWLAARAEGVGVGWVSILDPSRLRDALALPDHLVLVAYLCIGYVDAFGNGPELERLGWEKRADLDDCISYDRYQEARP